MGTTLDDTVPRTGNSLKIKGRKIKVQGLDTYLLPERAAYLPEHNLLIIADWYLGKGRVTTASENKENLLSHELNKLQDLLKAYNIEKVLFLGNLFHDPKWAEYEPFQAFIAGFSNVEFIWVASNDAADQYETLSDNKYKLQIREQYVVDKVFFFSQEQDNFAQEGFQVVASQSPGYIIQGKAGQNYRMPCFLHEEDMLVLPAFGQFTDMNLIEKVKGTKIYAILANYVMAI